LHAKTECSLAIEVGQNIDDLSRSDAEYLEGFVPDNCGGRRARHQESAEKQPDRGWLKRRSNSNLTCASYREAKITDAREVMLRDAGKRCLCPSGNFWVRSFTKTVEKDDEIADAKLRGCLSEMREKPFARSEKDCSVIESEQHVAEKLSVVRIGIGAPLSDKGGEQRGRFVKEVATFDFFEEFGASAERRSGKDVVVYDRRAKGGGTILWHALHQHRKVRSQSRAGGKACEEAASFG